MCDSSSASVRSTILASQRRRNILNYSLVRDGFILLMLNYTIEVFHRSIENAMQQQRSIAPLRLAMFTFTPAKIQACVIRASGDHRYISILLLKRKHSYQFASGVKPSSLSARVFAGNQSGSSLSYSVAA